MKIIQLGNTDKIGAAFNGQNLHKNFRARGIESYHIVWEKRGLDINTFEMVNSSLLKRISNFIGRLESRFSLQSLLYPWPLFLFLKRQFLLTSIVHYHLIHTGYFSLVFLPILSRLKPSVLTLHDYWNLTGHCVYPINCEKWKSENGCGECPDLKIQVAMRKDKTSLMWKIKKFIYSISKFDVIVASQHMKNVVQQSSFFSKSKVHYVPFGVDLKLFTPVAESKKTEIRAQLGIKPGNIVICLRATPSLLNGIQYIFEVLEKLDVATPITILTFEVKGMFDHYLGKHQVVDLGWVDNLKDSVDAYQASDIFLMLSMTENYNTMVMEAMACAKPVVVFEGTSLPEVVFAPEGGVAVPRNTDALAKVLSELIHDPMLREKLGKRARELSEQHYDFDKHADSVLAVYQDILYRKKSYQAPSASATVSETSKS